MKFVNSLVLCLFCAHFCSRASANLCPIGLKGQCQCVDMENDPYSVLKENGIRVECTDTSASVLHHDIDKIYKYFNHTRPIHALQVRNSKLAGLRGLPAGLVDIRHLILDNTGIDLEQVRESNELLVGLKSLRVSNENLTEIPENFFLGFHELNVLELNDIGIRVISEDGFSHLEDSLKELRLRENKLRSIPISIITLSRLETLDLENNDIRSVPDDLTANLESGLKSLNKLKMNRINCTCDFGRTDFVAWIRSMAIKGATCYEPADLNGRDISTTPIEDFCKNSSSSNLLSIMSVLLWILIAGSLNF